MDVDRDGRIAMEWVMKMEMEMEMEVEVGWRSGKEGFRGGI